ncbi:MAG: PAS domain S-box protein [Bryobacterales bacterium]|nr:PAS domain S-box protein [Bryobacterales bacterium]
METPSPTLDYGELAAENQALREHVSELEERVANLRRLEDTIERNAAVFEALIAASGDGIVLTTIDGDVLRLVKGILGYQDSALRGHSLFSLVHREDIPRLQHAYWRLRTGADRQVTVEVRIPEPDGAIRWIESVLTDMRDHPALMAVVCNHRDVTARRQAELVALELAAMARVAPCAIFAKAPDGTIQSWNPGAERMFGYTAPEIVGSHISSLIPPELRSEEGAQSARIIERGETVSQVRTVRIHKDGAHLPVELTMSPLLRDGELRGIAHICRLV